MQIPNNEDRLLTLVMLRHDEAYNHINCCDIGHVVTSAVLCCRPSDNHFIMTRIAL